MDGYEYLYDNQMKIRLFFLNKPFFKNIFMIFKIFLLCE